MSRLSPLLLVLAALSGCSPTAGKSWGAGGGSVVKVEDGVTTSYDVQRLTCNDRVYLVLAANGCRGSGVGGGNGVERGQLLTTDGRPVAWSCTTRDGNTGQVVIDGQAFDLAAGALFLVSTKDRPTRVEQVAVPADRLQAVTGTDTFPDLAAAEPKVAAFLRTCRDREPAK